MNEKESKALRVHSEGYSCSQAVVAAFLDEASDEGKMAMSLAVGFGGGMGQLRRTCGALTGGCMVLGLHNQALLSNPKEMKENTYRMVREADKRFHDMLGATDCKTLLSEGVKPENETHFVNDGTLTKCQKCILAAVRIVDGIVEDNNDSSR